MTEKPKGKMIKQKSFKVIKLVELTWYVSAENRQQAIEIANDMGDSQAQTDSKQYAHIYP